MHIGPKTKLDELLCTYPFLKDFLIQMDQHFKTLDNPLVRKTLGRVATLSRVAMVGGIELNKLMDDIAGEITRRTGEGVTVEREENILPRASGLSIKYWKSSSPEEKTVPSSGYR